MGAPGGRGPGARGRAYPRAELLERALRDTDELQELWVRFVVPAAGSAIALVAGDAVVAVLPPHGHWLAAAATLLAAQLLGCLALVANVGPLVAVDRRLRRRRGEFRAALVELGAVSPELTLLGARTFLDDRLKESRQSLAEAEGAALRRSRRSSLVAPAATALALAALLAEAPRSAPVWTVVAVLLALGTFEGLSVVRTGLDTAVAVTAAAERLEELDEPESTSSAPWPPDSTLVIERLTIREESRLIVDHGSFVVGSGRRVAITGPSGAGKSTLLRVLASLDEPDGGLISIGGTPLEEIAEGALRAHLAYVPSPTGLLRGYARDVVALGRAVTRPVETDLAALGIVVESTTRWTSVSRGEAQRIAIVRALAVGPSIVILDEPTSGLGRQETAAVLALLRSCGASVVVATHDAQVIAWCDDVVDLADGALVAVSR